MLAWHGGFLHWHGLFTSQSMLAFNRIICFLGMRVANCKLSAAKIRRSVLSVQTTEPYLGCKQRSRNAAEMRKLR